MHFYLLNLNHQSKNALLLCRIIIPLTHVDSELQSKHLADENGLK